MNVPDYFQKGLALINRNYFCVWNDLIGRYEIRCWLTDTHVSWDMRNYDLYSKKSWVRLRICYRNDDDQDISFKPIDQRVLYALKIAEKESEDPELMLMEVDEANRQNELKIDRNLDEHFRDMAKDIWKFCRTITVDQGGKKW